MIDDDEFRGQLRRRLARGLEVSGNERLVPARVRARR